MTSAPTRGAVELSDRRWSRSPAASFAVRAVARLLPLVGAWLAIRLASRWFWQPSGWTGLAIWVAQAIVVAVVATVMIERFARRLLPLALLLNLSLIFPDQAPSRFAVALRAGSTKKLQRRLHEIESVGLGNDANDAAPRALELVASLSRHDRRTRGHTERVRAYSDLIAEEMELDDEDRLRLAWGVLLHDVGKLTVPSEILNKKERLTPEEWKILKGHPEAGRRMLEPMADWLGPWILAASEHHERWDGAGYPLGLAGTDISLAGRITAVADAYDVITSKRSYKEPMSTEAARQELVRCAGTQFDPAVVRAFLGTSLGRRWAGGPLAWLLELPSVGQIGSGVTAVASATAASAAAVAAVGAPLPHEAPPVIVAIDESAPASTTTTVPTGAVLAEPVPVTLPPTTVSATTAPAATNPPPTTTTVPHAPSDQVVTPAATIVVTLPPTTTEPLDLAAITTIPPSPRGVPESTPTTTMGPATATTAPTPSTTAPAPTDTSGPATTSIPTTTTSPGAPATTTTTTTTVPPPPASSFVALLGHAGTGNTELDPIQAMKFGPPDSDPLPNYDIDQDAMAGRLVGESGVGLATNEDTDYQTWVWTAPSATRLQGTAVLTLFVKAHEFEPDEQFGVRIGLYRCAPTCTLLRTGTWSQGWPNSAFVPATVDLGSVDVVFGAGDELRVKVVVPSSVSDRDVHLAYDTESYPANLKIG